jgi:hypothetical protein
MPIYLQIVWGGDKWRFCLILSPLRLWREFTQTLPSQGVELSPTPTSTGKPYPPGHSPLIHSPYYDYYKYR